MTNICSVKGSESTGSCDEGSERGARSEERGARSEERGARREERGERREATSTRAKRLLLVIMLYGTPTTVLSPVVLHS